MSLKNRCLALLLVLVATAYLQPVDGLAALEQDHHQRPVEEESRVRKTRGNYISDTPPPVTYYQPALIGFRCETTNEVTREGISVIEANTPVKLTLFGELFTTNTIVAFTTEFRPDTDQDPKQSTHTLDLSQHQHTTTAVVATGSGATPSTDGPSQPKADDRLTGQRLFAQRRRSQSKSYDCTDYNRVVSYKLQDANILTPNIAVIEVTLPELSPHSGLYYYFCLKQPALQQQQQQQQQQKMELPNGTTATTTINEQPQLVWVHQGDEWWVTLKVEPPILSVATDCLLIVFLLLLSALSSGLNLGLMSLDMNELAVISSCGDPRERSYARTIAPLRKRGNYLLCSLLLANVMVNSSLTVILEEMTSGPVAVVGSTLAIVVLGEIVPQAFCARQGLAIGARTIYLTYFFMIITFPISFPISWLLDYVLGEEKGNVYDRERLMEFIKITGHHTQLDAEEVAIISGALKLKKIKVDQIMTRIEDVFMLPIDCKLDRDTIKRIIEKGYSRIPVYEFGDRKQIVALILAKDLALLDPDDHTPIANMLMYCKHPLIFIEDDATLDVALNEFKTGKSHMAVVRQIYDDGEVDKYYEAIGVVTLEDVIEEVLQAEINDETDILSDNRRKRRRTDCAQLAHLMIDELTCATGSQQSSQLLSCDSSQFLCGKQIQTSLSSHLTSVSLAGGTQSQLAANLSQQQPLNCNQQPAKPKDTVIEVEKENGQGGAEFMMRTPVQGGESSSNQQVVVRDPNQQQPTTVQAAVSENELEPGDSGMLVRAAQFLSNIMP